MKHKTQVLYAVLLVSFVGAVVSLVWAVRHSASWSADRVFQGKPEHYWVTNVSYSPSDVEIKQWQEFGPEGVRVLIRGLEKANHAWEKKYRSIYRQVAPRLPVGLARFLPNPKMDSTRGTRMCLVSFICKLGTNATMAEPIMARMLSDEDASVQQLAINFFTWGESETALLNQLDPKEKRRLLPAFIRALRNQTHDGLRNNAAIALKYYPEHRQIVVPALVAALNDPVPRVRLMVAGALNQVDPDTSKRVRAVSVVIPILKDPDNQVAFRAAGLLGNMKNEAELAVPALIEALENPDELVACTAVWMLEALERGGQLEPYVKTVIPALTKAAERKDSVAGYARFALKRFQPQQQ
ncbi:MAG: HEAT repeat domain-containing protein [Verrucomicrobia bacterium]|nr:HEAT repeat domain-containing protein [Verrucomicrobiota bacterium]